MKASQQQQRSVLVPHDSIYFSDKQLLCLSLLQMFDAAAWQLFCQEQQAFTSRNTEMFTHKKSQIQQSSTMRIYIHVHTALSRSNTHKYSM